MPEAPVTAPESPEAPTTEPVVAVPETADELSTLKSRNSGLNSKVTDLQTQLAAERAARTVAEQAAAGKAGTDDVLNKRIAELQAELEAGKTAAAIATLGAKYPESFTELGEGIANLTSDKLASLEARLTAAKDDGEEAPAKPVGNNAGRGNGAPKSIDDMNSAELQAAIKGLSRADMGLPERS